MSTDTCLSLFAEKESKRFKLKVGVFLFLMQDDQVLLLRRYRTGIADGSYVLPMGGHDGNGPLYQTLIREAEEETNIRLTPADVQVCHVMHRFHSMPHGLSFEQIDVFFKVLSYEGTIVNREPEVSDELKFFPINDLPENTAPFIQSACQNILNGQFFSHFGWEEKSLCS